MSKLLGIASILASIVAISAGAETPPSLVSFDDLQKRLGSPEIRLIDARSKADYDNGHIPGAIQVDPKDVEARAKTPGALKDREAWETWVGTLGIGPEMEVLIYDGNRQLDSARLWWLLRYLGVDRAGLIDGGFALWKKEKRPVGAEGAKVEPRPFRVAFRDDRSATRAEVMDLLKQPAGSKILDARSLGEHTGAILRSKRGGHIPSACNLEWSRLVDADGRFLDRSTLRTLAIGAGIRPGEPVVTHCQGGGRASVAAFAMERLGSPVRNFYPGWSEWGNAAETPVVAGPAEVRAAFQKLLDRPHVDLDPQIRMSRPIRDGLVIERIDFAVEKLPDGLFERVPTLLIRPQSAGASSKRPVVVLLHGTGGGKDGMRPWLEEFARLGFVAVAIDARHHGDRAGEASGTGAYYEAITRAWRSPPGKPQAHPVYYDTCWDLWRLVDYLQSRPDVDPSRIGMVGESMGGIETWLAASVDPRIAVAVPAISVQSFRWGLEHDRWQGRSKTLWKPHFDAAKDLGRRQVDREVCEALWGKILPGICDEFDAPSMLRLFAGRPLFIVNGETDPNCPIEGARIAFDAAASAFQDAGTPEKLKISVAEGVGHQITRSQRKEIAEWLVKWLRPGEPLVPEKP